MIKQVLYMSQETAEEIVFNSTDALISITEPNKSANVEAEHLLRLEFDDHDPKNDNNVLLHEYTYDEQQLFTEEQAQQILEFIDDLPDEVDTIYVHCFMGISRSRAVACAIREFEQISLEPMSQWQMMNKHVYRVLTDTWFGSKLGDSFKEI